MAVQRIFIHASAIAMTILFIVMMAIYPAESLRAALTGVAIWWDVLFPALFPFFIIAELLLSFGIVHFFGTLLDPLMRPLFRVPGIGGFVMAMGFASGYPVGARLTSQLWDERLINREEGERLVAFTSTSDPIFLIGAVAVGFFHDPGLALILSIAHYGSGIIVGLVMRFHDRKSALTPPTSIAGGSILMSAIRNMHQARLSHPEPFGTKLQDAAMSAIRLIFVIGGLVVFFSVLIELLSLTNVISLISGLISGVLSSIGMPSVLSDAFISGLFEVTLGAQSAGSAAGAGLMFQTATAAFILSWAGLSVHAQIISLMSHTGMRYGPFLFARLLHGTIAMWLVFMLWSFINHPASAWFGGWPVMDWTVSSDMAWRAYSLFPILVALGMIMLAALCLLSLGLHLTARLLATLR